MPVQVVGYAYQADIWCADCMKTHARARLAVLGDTTDYATAEVEDVVTAWAHTLGLTYPTSVSDAHDTNDFPSPILSTSEDADDRCGQVGCGQRLWDSG